MGELQKMPNFGVGKDFETAVTKLENDLKSIADGEVVIAGDKNNPIVDDKTFDNLKKEIIELEKNNKFLKSEKSPSATVGFQPSKKFFKAFKKSGTLSKKESWPLSDSISTKPTFAPTAFKAITMSLFSCVG